MNTKRPFDLTGKNAVVTGGGSGIGKAISTLFAAQGATVEIYERDAEAASTAVDEIEAAGGKAAARACDVSDPQAVRAAFAATIAAHGRLHILVNNAGVAHVGNVGNTSLEDFERVMRINSTGVFLCLQEAVKHMAANGGGAILNVASAASVIAVGDRFAYMASKGAVWTMTMSVAKDYLAAGIRCNALAPGRIHTPFVDGFIRKNYPGREAEMFEKLSQYQPVGRMGKPEEVAAAALFLCSDEASFATGGLYPIDGGTINLR